MSGSASEGSDLKWRPEPIGIVVPTPRRSESGLQERQDGAIHAGQAVQANRQAARMLHANRQVILQVRSHARPVRDDRDAEFA